MTSSSAGLALQVWDRLSAAVWPFLFLLLHCLIGGDLRAQRVQDIQPAIDVVEYDFHLDLTNPPHLEGTATITWLLRKPVPKLYLYLEQMEVLEAGLGKEQDRVDYDGRRLSVAVPEHARPAEDTLVLRVRYRGRPADGLLFQDGAADCIGAFGDNWPDRARFWLPVVDHPSDKAAVTWRVRAEESCDVVANGELLSVTLPSAGEGGWREFVWREERPIPTYLMVVAVARFSRYDLGMCSAADSGGQHRIRHELLVDPDLGGDWPGPFCTAPEILRFFEELIGPYPYGKLFHVQSGTRFGGMENAGIIFYSDRAFRGGTIGPGLIAHETAHQWFGNAVSIQDWPHLWLSEGLATYMAALWTQRSEGDPVFRRYLQEMRERVLKAEVVRRRPVVDTLEQDTRELLNANTYQKGAWVLHMLRALSGDSAFFGGLRAYYTAFRHGNATTDQFRDVMERSCGLELKGFFDQWLRRAGIPEFRHSWQYDPVTAEVVLKIEHRYDPPLFSVPLSIDLLYDGGERRRVSTSVPAEREATIRLATDLKTAPSGVLLDPMVELLAGFHAETDNP